MMNNFKLLSALTRRNIKLYFKDKTTFFMSLITPFILLILFVLFLKNTYASTLEAIVAPLGVEIDESVKNGFVSCWLVSSIVSTSAVSVSFCSATLMVNDKLTKAGMDIDVAPTPRWIKNLSYLFSTFFSTIIIMFIILIVGFIYIAFMGWYLSFVDVLSIVLTTILLTLFGSSLSCIVFNFVKSQGGISTIATLVSSCYGFMSGAYMPLSQYPKTMASILGINPGVYANCLLKNYFMGGSIEEITSNNTIPTTFINEIKDGFDLNYYFFDNQISVGNCFVLLIGIVTILLGIYIFLSIYKRRVKR